MKLFGIFEFIENFETVAGGDQVAGGSAETQTGAAGQAAAAAASFDRAAGEEQVDDEGGGTRGRHADGPQFARNDRETEKGSATLLIYCC